jgi:glycosyltransferase involved in cell wall biosynthesis
MQTATVEKERRALPNGRVGARILIVVENAPVPFDTRVWKEAQALHANGYSVTVLCPRGKGCERGHEILEGIRVYRHPTPREAGSTVGYLWEYSVALLWECAYSWWIFLRHGFDIIQGCNPPDDIVFVALPFRLFGVRYIFDHHDATPELYLSKGAKPGIIYKVQVLLERITYALSDVIIATNNSYKELAIQRGGRDPKDVFVVRNGPDLSAVYLVRPVSALRQGKRYLVGYVGTMGSQDGLDILLDVALHIKRLGRLDIHFTCVGGGPALASLRAMVNEKELADMVTFTGRIPQTDMLEILSTADVCVNPDRPCRMNDISTMIKVMEYMALAKPIVQFESTEGRFSAGAASLYASPRENYIADFATKILTLLDDESLRHRMGELGRERVRTELAWDYSVDHLLAAYKRVEEKGQQWIKVRQTEIR